MSRTSTARVAGVLLVLWAVVALPGRAGAADEELEPLGVSDPAVTTGMAWHLDAIGARVAWRSSLGASVRVAVVDSGVDSTHPDLLGQVEDAVTCIGAAGSAEGCKPGGVDEDGHGTHVAGIIAARADDNIGVAGVAPRAKILSVKALEAKCEEGACVADGDAGDLAAGVRWAIGENVDVINLSVSAPYRLAPDLLDAIGEAWEAGAVVVLSAGSRTDQPMFFDTSSALVVTATDRNGDLAPYAPRLADDAIAVAAPGGLTTDTELTCHEHADPVGIVSSVPIDTGDGSGYECLAGTSMAAAQVSGGLALLLSMGFSRDEAVDRLLGTAVPGDGLALGLIDLGAAVANPYPPGVSNRHDAMDTGVLPPPASELPTTGPFAAPVEEDDDDPAVPLWVVMVAGAVVVALLAELGLRLAGRRHQSGAGAPTGDAEGSDGTDTETGEAPLGKGVFPSHPPEA
jgi:subtilisin family serine protease